ncbi:MAG: arginine N-succinyltransferase [Deltaproteobacteria bacterium]|nr:arginine N-succinyltransferase [Deltaproteobacteria bacterium]
MFLLRAIQPDDSKQVLSLAKLLAAVNLAGQPEELQKQIQKSMAAFSGETRNKGEADYILCLEDLESKRIIGTSMIMAQHGTKDVPHFYFQVLRLEKFSQTMHSGIVHQVLRLGYDMDGPTEVGGLVLHPAFRHTGKHLGKLLSWSRFLFIAMHRRRFKDRIIAEFLPPLTPDGKSLLWEAIGQKFTNLPYMEADRISRKNKEFILSLFPRQDIYICLLEARVRELIGQVGEESLPAKKMLESIGFKYLEMIDPFDGGPHYGARMKDVTLVKKVKALKFKKANVRQWKEIGIVGHDKNDDFRAVATEYKTEGKNIYLPTEARETLGIEQGDSLHFLPFEPDSHA